MTNPDVCSRTGNCWQPTELVTTLLSASAREVVRHWISCNRFLDASNEPTLLPMASSDETGFNALVSQVNRDLAPAVIFNELLRKGIVEQHESGCLLLRRSAYVPDLPHRGDGAPVVEDFMAAPRRRRNDLI
ncbi:MAG: hypothetical protein ABR522_14950 [Marinobacter sp.]